MVRLQLSEWGDQIGDGGGQAFEIIGIFLIIMIAKKLHVVSSVTTCLCTYMYRWMPFLLGSKQY